MSKEIYRTFEQWKGGNVLEHGVPRTEYYSEDQLDLVEMGWNYGYDAGRAVEQALDKKAENARKLGLDYEPVGEAYLCNKCQTPFDGAWECPNCGHRSATKEPVYTTPPAAQRQWVGLTDEQIADFLGDRYRAMTESELEFFRLGEAAHGITKGQT
jgi:DNA-directed RNA polymerase subunit RPC12/RpoP